MVLLKVFLRGDYNHFVFYMQRGSVHMGVVCSSDFSNYLSALPTSFLMFMLSVEHETCLAVSLDFSLCTAVMMQQKLSSC